MGRPKKADANRLKIGDIVPAPHDHLFTGHDPDEARLVTALMRAGEEIAAPAMTEGAGWKREENPAFAEPVAPTPPLGYGRLLPLLEQIKAHLAQDEELSALIARLPEAFGDGRMLWPLFRSLFTERKAPPTRDADGAPVLTDREVEVLREAAGDISEQEIAVRLGISRRTVNTHFANIYRKLGVQRPMQAVSRAVTMGFLDMDVFDLLTRSSRCNIGDFGLFSALVGYTEGADTYLSASGMKPVADLALLLLVLSGAAKGFLALDEYDKHLAARSAVWELDVQGWRLSVIGGGYVEYVSAMVVAPPHAALQGFTPGNVFMLDCYAPQQGLNLSAVVEFAPDGRFVRRFHGGRDMDTRLVNAGCLAFAPEGCLLVSSGGLTDALLAFSAGGARVERFAEGVFSAVCVGPGERIYAVQHSSIGDVIKVLDAAGNLLSTFGGLPPGEGYTGLAVLSDSRILAEKNEPGGGFLETYDAKGARLSFHPVSGSHCILLALDSRQQVYLSEPRSGCMLVCSLEGTIKRRIPLPEKRSVGSLLAWEDGRMWVGTARPP
jgi:DNA-binding CsgD family transcriptional regulator